MDIKGEGSRYVFEVVAKRGQGFRCWCIVTMTHLHTTLSQLKDVTYLLMIEEARLSDLVV